MTKSVFDELSHGLELSYTDKQDAEIKEWIKATAVFEKVDGKPLCAGARITLDANYEGVLSLDSSLPDGVCVVSYPGGGSFRYENVWGPMESIAESVKESDE